MPQSFDAASSLAIKAIQEIIKDTKRSLTTRLNSKIKEENSLKSDLDVVSALRIDESQSIFNANLYENVQVRDEPVDFEDDEIAYNLRSPFVNSPLVLPTLDEMSINNWDQIQPNQPRNTDDSSTNLLDCLNCGEAFTNLGSLTKHLRSNHSLNVNSYHCDECNKTFAHKSRFKTHKLTHVKKKFECTNCHKKLSKQGLKLHMSLHTGELPFTCEKCDVKFRLKSYLARHVKLKRCVK